MPRKPPDFPWAIPPGCEQPIRKTMRVDLLKMTRLLLDHLTPALCEAVFQRHRTTERTPTWTFYAVPLCWAAMVIRHPPSLHHWVDETRKGRGRDKWWPRVMATPQAFFKKAQRLRPHLFQATYAAFTRSILPKAQPADASWLTRVRQQLPAVLIVDGSRLDTVCHRLKLLLRVIRYRAQGHRLDLLTNVLDPTRLPPEDALALYRLRWSVERLFLDLKETLDLHGLYASHPNLVAQQVYAAAIGQPACRVAQAGIAQQAHVLPEQLSPATRFPKLAQAANDHCVAQVYALKTRALNPGVVIRFPGWHVIPSAYTTLDAIIVQHRNSHRRRRKFCLSRKRWNSFAHVKGGPTLLQSVSDG